MGEAARSDPELIGCTLGQKSTTKARPAPLISDELIEYLDSLYPEKCPTPSQTGRQIWMDVGARAVVLHLKSQQAAQRSR